MSSRKISQREARKNLKQLRETERRCSLLTSRYASEFPGVRFRSITVNEGTRDTVNLARSLGHGVAAKMDGDTLNLYVLNPK